VTWQNISDPWTSCLRPTYDQLISISEVGPKVARSVVTFLWESPKPGDAQEVTS